MPWQDDSDWDDALRASDGIRVGGEKGGEYLVRPDQLVCDAVVWTSPRDADEEEVRARLADAGATELGGDDPRIGSAERLDLKLLEVPSDAAYDVVDAAQDIAPGKVDFNHVLVANPQRYGGCGMPEPSTTAVAIPGTGREGATMRIAVLDTGVADGTSWVDPASEVESGQGGPASGHGTMVAGVIARYAPGATILVRQVLRLPLGVADELEVAAALDAVPGDIQVINASFGGPAADSGRMETLRRSLRRLPKGTLVVASAGNEGLSRRHYMAAFERVVGVASVEDGEVAHYSNRGEWIKLSTQGTDVETLRSENDRVKATGTSFAAPKIAARIVTDAGPGGDVNQAAAGLIQSGQPVAGAGVFIDIP